MLTIADLDLLTCRPCGLFLRDHCTERDGFWVYRPCRLTLISQAPETWRLLIDDGLCGHCRRTVEDHFEFIVPQASVIAHGVTTDIQPSGDIVVYAAAFRDCRQDPPEPRPCNPENADGLPQGLGNPWHPRHFAD